MYGIKRNDADASGKGAGWRVVLTRERVRYRAFFRAGGYPNMEHALAAAQAFRDALLKLLPPIKPYVMRAQKPRSGMQRVVRLDGKRPAWLAELRVDGR